MKSTRKWKKASFSTIFWATASILLCTLPCNALVIPDGSVDTVTVPSSDYLGPINENVAIESGGTLNLLVGGQINGTIGVAEGGTLNLEGGNILYDVSASGEVNIKGGGIGGNGSWDIYVVGTAEITVFGTNFSVTGGTIDLSGTYFTADEPFAFCHLTGSAGEIDLIFYIYYSTTRIYLAEPSTTIEVQIDIKPGSCPNSINLGSNGVVPVAILSSNTFEATTVDPDTVLLAGAGVAVRGKSNKSLAHEEDVNDDGLMDLVCQVETENLDPGQLQDGYAVLTGNLLPEFGGAPIEGSDEITIVPRE